MDETDFRVLLTLLQEPFAANERIGRATGMTGTSVKNRLDKLAREIRFRGLRLVPSPASLGRVARGRFYRAAATDELVARALGVDPVVWLVGHHDGLVSVLTFDEPDAPGAADSPEPHANASLNEVMGAPPVKTVDLQLTRLEKDPVLSPLAWRVLRAYLDDARRPILEAAEDAKLGRRTVSRRRDALLDTGAAYVSPLWDEARAAGALLFHLIATGETNDARAAILNAAGPGALPYATLTRPPGLALVSMAHSAAEALEVQRRVAAAPSVREAMLNFPTRNEYAAGRVRRWVEEKIAGWGGGRG